MSTTKDYIPANPDEFNAYQANFVNQVDIHAPEWNILLPAITPLHDQRMTWDTVYPKAANPQNRTPADVLARQEAQTAYTAVIRTFANQQLMNNPLVTDPDKERLGLHVHSGERHPVRIPDTSPAVIRIDTSESQRHTIHFADEGGALAKPDGVHGCEIYMKKGAEPASDAELTFAGTDTRSPFVVNFDIADMGQTVHYKLRWVNTRAQHGPWSKLASAVVA
jgi:hypothetical protein